MTNGSPHNNRFIRIYCPSFDLPLTMTLRTIMRLIRQRQISTF